jgi:D-glycero-D-manno-heptose 1,7-bisphosphate phosphatase
VSRRPGIFLDRDGVLNEAFLGDGSPIPPRTPADFRLLPGVVEACTTFAEHGLALVVVTNQPDLARGALSRADLEAMHDVLRTSLPLDAIMVCEHDSAEGCPCRKPRPGMILEAARALDLDLDASVAVGDRWRDIDAARRAGVHAVHIEWNHGESLRQSPDATFSSLFEARDHILAIATSAPQRGAKEITQ